MFALVPMIRFSIALGAVVALAGCAGPQERVTPEDPLLVTVEEFRVEQQALRARLEAGQPRELQRGEWQEFDRIQQGFQRNLDGVSTIDDLPMARRLEVYNLQEDLAVLLVGELDDERVYCTRQRRTGTHLVTTRCRSRQELARERKNSREGLEQYWHRNRGAVDPEAAISNPGG